MGQLSALKIKALKEPGRYSDGDGLMLQIGAGGARSWILRAQTGGKRRDFGLGSAKWVSLADAREAAGEIRRQLAKGIDPIAERKREREVIPTFKDAAVSVHKEQKAGWKNGKHQAQWLSTLETYAYPTLAKLPVNEIEGPQIRKVLLPIWLTKPETARRVRQRIGAVLDWSYVNGFRTSEAPMRSLSKGLPRQPKDDGHFAAMSYALLPNFISRLRERSSVGRVALEALVLTAARSGEIRGKPHQVPLSAQAVDAFTRAKKYKVPCSDLVFPGQKLKKPMSDMTLLKVVRDMEAGVTVHGFRSAFRDWVAEETDVPGEIAEAALAHANSNKVEAAYRRTDFLEKRKALMRDWGAFCGGKAEST